MHDFSVFCCGFPASAFFALWVMGKEKYALLQLAFAATNGAVAWAI